MIKEDIAQLFTTGLQKLSQEIAGYEDEPLIWKTVTGISNSSGNLCLHLLGNLNSFVGATLGNTGYVRNREQEFSQKNIPKAALLEMIGQLKVVIENTLPSLSEQQLTETYPGNVLGYPMSTLHFLIHLVGHLNYHLGQINYHRRILTNLS